MAMAALRNLGVRNPFATQSWGSYLRDLWVGPPALSMPGRFVEYVKNNPGKTMLGVAAATSYVVRADFKIAS